MAFPPKKKKMPMKPSMMKKGAGKAPKMAAEMMDAGKGHKPVGKTLPFGKGKTISDPSGDDKIVKAKKKKKKSAK
jgi:hypothetical protein